MHYPDRPKRGDLITAQSANRAADGITASRIVGADRMVVSQSTTGVRLIAPSPMQMTLVILTTDWTRTGPPEWWIAEGEEAILHSDQIAYVKQPVRRVRVASPVAIGGAGTTVLAWWDTNSGWWLTIPSGDISPISGGSGDSGASGGSGDSGASGGSGGEGSGADDVIVRCGDCLGRLCVTRDPYTGYITGIYYQTTSGLVAVPECESGSGYDYDSGSGSGSDSGPPPPCAGLMSYTTAGTYTFTAPCDGTYIIECWGGGGGGKGGGDGMAGGGGGGGSYCRSVLTLTAGTYTVVVGAGGAGGTNGGAGANGGHSSFGAGLVVAAGGFGATSHGGAGPGTGNVGQVIHVGGSGTSGFGHAWGGGGGGASGHPAGPGANGGISSPTSGGAGGPPATDGGGGGGGGDPYQHGLPGGWPGGGGGGGGSDDPPGTNGGAGGDGRVRITWPAT